MSNRREIISDPSWIALHPDDGRTTFFAALMQCAPGEEPQTSQEELLPLRDVIEDALDVLDPRERWVFNAIIVERMSLRALGRQLQIPKTTVARIRDRAAEHLRKALEDNPEIQRRLGLDNGDDENDW